MAKVAAGELLGKKRKERSDKGKRRKGTKMVDGKHKRDTNNSEEDEDEVPSPKKKNRKGAPSAVTKASKKLPPAPKSKALIASDNEEDSLDEV